MAKKYTLKLKGFVGGWNFDADFVDYVLEKNAGKPVTVLIDSLGGGVGAALSISAAFRNHGDVSVHYQGMNASAATIASMGAKHVSIDANAMYLVHKCSSVIFKWAQLNADQLAEYIKECERMKRDQEKIDLNIASAYAARCKRDKKELLDLMKEGAWLSAQEALKWGFVDEITNDPDASKPTVTDEVVSYMMSAGIPMPPGVEKEKQNFLSRMAQAFKEALSPNTAIQNITKMKKVYKCVCALLKVEGLESENGLVTITEQQMQTIEDAQAEAQEAKAKAESKLAEQKNKVAELETKVTDLQTELTDAKKPAEESKQVVEEGKQNASETDSYVDALNSAKELLKQV